MRSYYKIKWRPLSHLYISLSLSISLSLFSLSLSLSLSLNNSIQQMNYQYSAINPYNNLIWLKTNFIISAINVAFCYYYNGEMRPFTQRKYRKSQPSQMIWDSKKRNDCWQLPRRQINSKLTAKALEKENQSTRSTHYPIKRVPWQW